MWIIREVVCRRFRAVVFWLRRALAAFCEEGGFSILTAFRGKKVLGGEGERRGDARGESYLRHCILLVGWREVIT